MPELRRDPGPSDDGSLFPVTAANAPGLQIRSRFSARGNLPVLSRIRRPDSSGNSRLLQHGSGKKQIRLVGARDSQQISGFGN